MKTSWLVFAVLLTLALGAAVKQCPLITAPESATKTGCYIVVLYKETSQEKFKEILEIATSVAEGNKIYGVVKFVLKAFSVKLCNESLSRLRSIPEVQYVEEETMAKAGAIPYHLDRLDQRKLPLDMVFNPMGDGEGVDIYILDTGISYGHKEFGGRAKYGGFDAVDAYLNENYNGYDCEGHGTHVASNAAGATYGAAKRATLYSVRVLDCTSFAPWMVIIKGVDYARYIIPKRKRSAVVSMSITGPFSQCMNDAVEALYRSEVTVAVVVAAGNNAGDACSTSPASAPNAITVAGSANDDELYVRTNYGSCVDIFAPGQDIQGADYRCSTCGRTGSGTSYAAPLVSGAIAILLQRNPELTPDAILSELTSLSTRNALNFDSIPPRFRPLTPNRLLFIPVPCGVVAPIEVPPSLREILNLTTTIQSPNYPSYYNETLRCTWTIIAPNNSRLRVTFADFATEFKYDNVKLCNTRHCKPSTRLVTLSGRRKLTPCLKKHESTSNVLTIEFNTDSTTELTGFNATVTAFEDIKAPIF